MRLIYVLCVVLLSLTGCGGGAEKAGKTKMRYWTLGIHDLQYVKSMVAKYNREHDDVEWEITSQVGATLGELIELAYSSKPPSPPDVYTLFGGSNFNQRFQQAIEDKWIIPQSRYMTPEWRARFPVGTWREGYTVRKGEFYAPSAYYGGQLIGLIYNKTIFREAGLVDGNGEPTPPRTWSEFRDYARIITEKGRGADGKQRYYGLVIGAKDDWVWNMILSDGLAGTAGAFIEDPRTWQYHYDDPGMIAAVRLLLSLRDDGSVMPGALSMNDEQSRIAFGQDQAGMIIGGWWVPGGVQINAPSCLFDVAPIPIPDDGRKGYQRVNYSSNGLVISSYCKNPEKAWEFVSYTLSDSYVEGYIRAGLGITILPKLNRDEYYLSCQGMPAFSRLSQTVVKTDTYEERNAFGRSQVIEPPVQGYSGFGSAISAIWTGDKPVESTLHEYNSLRNQARQIGVSRARDRGTAVSLDDYVQSDWDPMVR